MAKPNKQTGGSKAKEKQDAKASALAAKAVGSTLENEFIDWCNSYMGEGCANLAQVEYDDGDKPRIPIDLFAFDFISGGGLPLWGISCFWGPDSSGKTTAALNAAAAFQQTCFCCWKPLAFCKCTEPRLMSVFWDNLEGDLDLSWARKLGVDLKRLVPAYPASGEQAVTAARQATTIANCGLVVVDSIADLVPASELTDDAFFSQEPGTQARLITKFVRVLRTELNRQKVARHPVAVIIINQMRSQIGKTMGSPETMSGGWGLRHSFALLVRFGKVALDAEKKKKYTDSDGRVRATRHTIKIAKHKVPIFADSGEFIRANDAVPSLGLRPGQVQDLNTVFKLALMHGVVSGDGPYKFMGVESPTQDKIKQLWQLKPEYYIQAKRMIIEAKRVAIQEEGA